MIARMSTDGESTWWTTWYRSSGSPEKSLSMITRQRGPGWASSSEIQGVWPRVQVGCVMAVLSVEVVRPIGSTMLNDHSLLNVRVGYR